jgi:ATP-dependent RNA helicase DeaD
MYFESEELSTAPAAAPQDGDSDGGLQHAPAALRAALVRRGFARLTEVQQAVLDADDGARDLRITSQTGSGKTVAIGFALVEALVDEGRRGPTTIVIAPTRELAMQVKEELGWLFADVASVHCEVVTGGTSVGRERQRLKRRPSVLVGTPGRLLDHLREGALDLGSVRQLVLDEADQMLDLGFKDELDGILSHLPATRRTHLVSATFPRAVLDLADRFQKAPAFVQGSAGGQQHVDIEHVACKIGSKEHYEALVNLLLHGGDDRALVFVRTREDTVTLADRLTTDGIDALPLNGDLAQSQRTRTLQAFRNGTVRVLVATDVAARGLDIQGVGMVVNVDLPIDAATYVHRSGRTGRAGQKGTSVMLVHKAAANRARRLYREAGIEATWRGAPTAEQVIARQHERLRESAARMVDGATDVPAALRTMADELLTGREPGAVVAALLRTSLATTRAPFEIHAPRELPPRRSVSPMAGLPRFAEQSAYAGANPFEQQDFVDQGLPKGFAGNGFAGSGSAGRGPAGKRAAAKPFAAPRGGGEFAPFRINWGARDGAEPRRILAHICRRGDIDSSMVGAITVDDGETTFEVRSDIANDFAFRARRPDRREPHLIIEPARAARPRTFGRQGTMRTRQSR